ncbi:MAG TPA: SDR family oxidoreductase [Galbitalea sp.]|jgi:NAD(P)-dependent dehydrogenase (short-subunit alcohol dehydrogenase family)|nr:SDR family oxidoreductase [Galbitalea sp.]
MKKIALITGANKGIGLETARQLAENEFSVLIGSRSIERGEAAASQLRQAGLDAVAIELDVSNDESIEEAANRITKEFDHLDVLVNNAGIYAPTTPAITTREVMRELFETNVFGVVAVTNAMLPLLRKSDAGRIVNVSSEVASLTIASDPDNVMYEMTDMAYQTSKTAVNMITVMYAKSLRESGIKVNAAIPGYVKTDFNGNTGYRSAADGATASVELALLAKDGPTGEYRGTVGASKPGEHTVAPW